MNDVLVFLEFCYEPSSSNQYASGVFEVGTNGCDGEAECQFLALEEAQNWCNQNTNCWHILEHEDDGTGCEGGKGCFTPRKGDTYVDDSWPNGNYRKSNCNGKIFF